MNREVKVSVVLPVYNAMPYLVKALDSLLAQTLLEMEVICVEDCSTDGSLKTLYSYAQKDNRVRVMQNDTNLGAGASRNYGMSKAEGECIIFLDADDVFESRMLETMYERAVLTDADIVVCDYVEMDETGNDKYTLRIPYWFAKKWAQDVNLTKEATRQFLPVVTGMVAWNKLYKKSFLITEELFFQDVYNCDDMFFAVTTSVAAERVAYLGMECLPMMHYRIRNTGSQSRVVREPLSSYLAGKEIIKHINNNPHKCMYRKTVFSILAYVIWVWLERMTKEQKQEFAKEMRKYGIAELGIDGWSKEDFFREDDAEKFKSVFLEPSTEDIAFRLGKSIYDVPNLFQELRNHGFHCLLWGYGRLGKIFLALCEQYAYQLAGIVDQSERLAGQKAGNYEIELITRDNLRKADAVIITNAKHTAGVRQTLREIGCDLTIIDVQPYCRFNIPFEECVYE